MLGRYALPIIVIVAIILGLLLLVNRPIQNPEGLPACESVAPGTLCYLASEDRATRFAPATASPTATPTLTATATPTAQPTPPSEPTATPEPVATPESEGDLLPPTDLLIEPVEGEPNAFIVFWSYPEEGATVPTEFEIVVDNVPYERTGYEGTDFNYSWYVGEQPCEGPLEVVVVAVAGDGSASSEPVEWAGC